MPTNPIHVQVLLGFAEHLWSKYPQMSLGWIRVYVTSFAQMSNCTDDELDEACAHLMTVKPK